ncbi:hypothetical protein ACFSUS_23330 [Spirosoma soli]|uniref:DUF5666 domain-containing protein n=1 Tax=Spirosoma soli TaxID=1770529 RepID=A0ABW5MBV8_9BACT
MKLYLTGLITLALLLQQCSQKQTDDITPDVEQPVQATYQVEYSANTVVIDDAGVKTLTKADITTGVYTFRNPPEAVTKLEVGQIVLLSGNSLRKVTSVQRSGSDVTVQTQPAALTEAIQNGIIAYDTDFRWTSAQAGGRVGATAGVQEWSRELTYSGTIAGWNTEMKLTPTPDTLRINLKLVKKVGGQDAAVVRAEGWLSNFQQHTDIRIQNGELTSFVHENRNLKGQIEVKFAAVQNASNVQATISVPAELSFPIRVGPIPMSLNIGLVAKVIPQLFGESSSEGSFKLTYDSDLGFAVRDGAPESRSALRNPLYLLTGKTGSAGFEAVGFGVGLEFPKISLRILGGIVVPSLVVNTAVYSVFEPPYGGGLTAACQEGDISIKAEAGVELSVLSLSYQPVQITLFNDRKTWKEGSCPP